MQEGPEKGLHRLAERTRYYDIHLLDICPDKAEIQHKIDVLSEGRFRRPVLIIGIDGAHAPTRREPSPRKGKRGKGEWKEVKGFRIYLLDNNEMVHLISWHQIKSDKELANDLLEIKQAGLIPEDKVRICFIGDGAPWIWNRAKEIYPDAKKYWIIIIAANTYMTWQMLNTVKTAKKHGSG